MLDEQGVRFDKARIGRIGLEEAVFAQSKTAERVAAIVEDAAAEGRRLLLTRLTPQMMAEQPEHVRALLDYDPLSQTAILGELSLPDSPPEIALVTAGTSDARVAAEARRTLAYSGIPAAVVADVGVAGLWRLLEEVEGLRKMSVLLVFAGMDAALPSVVAGLVPGSVIAVPTSVGYGVAEGGRAALDAALSSCAPGVVVVNIDNGYGAACAALRILNSQKALLLQR
ncbi:nickel pincer cofactor biosynthesis protein LarB [Telmatospirillum sp. J64-1]|uniref:nickel pincer cofactor biosynthesis protein LarB n=1 Tax=Telmatospirillum sp. J64-1 TaxID=2502183 RepID=UPI00115F3C29|nr:nickel pincer cofactor biosynthesis protein LarB [Telmatospirillum sp. J64-1]